MKSFLPDYTVSKVLLDSAHDAMSYYQYFKRENITPFIDLNGKGRRPPIYKNDFIIDKDGVPICLSGYRMRRDGIEVAKGRMKFKCPRSVTLVAVSPVHAKALVQMLNTDVQSIWF